MAKEKPVTQPNTGTENKPLVNANAGENLGSNQQANSAAADIPADKKNDFPEGGKMMHEEKQAQAKKYTAEELEEQRLQSEEVNKRVLTADDFRKALENMPDEQKDMLRDILAEKKPKMSADTLTESVVDQDDHERLTKKYGPGFVKAQRKAQRPNDQPQSTVFTAEAWKRLPAKPDGSRDSWHAVVKTPPEVNQLKNKKQ